MKHYPDKYIADCLLQYSSRQQVGGNIQEVIPVHQRNQQDTAADEHDGQNSDDEIGGGYLLPGFVVSFFRQAIYQAITQTIADAQVKKIHPGYDRKQRIPNTQNRLISKIADKCRHGCHRNQQAASLHQKGAYGIFQNDPAVAG